MSRNSRLVALLVPAVLLASPLLAQGGAERATIDSLFTELSLIGPTDPIPADSRCTPHSGTLGRFCRALLAVRRLEREPNADAAFNTEMATRRIVQEKPDWATAWYLMAMARLQLTRSGVLAREGPRQPLGVSAEAGAGLALVSALKLEPDFLHAAEALALAPIPREGASQLGERRDELRALRHRLPISAAARMGVGVVERESGHPDTAVAMFREAIEAGADTGVAYLEIARMQHKANKATEGRASLIAGAAFTASPYANQRYREELSWVASPQELAEWDSLPPSERSSWLDAFWIEREVRDGRAPGERMIEHYRRYEEAMKEFLIRVPQKGRQTFVSVAKAGDLLDEASGDPVGRAGMTTREGVPGAESREQVEQQRTGASEWASVVGPGAPFRDFAVTQDVLDDRGVIWIRHGKPTERAMTAGGTAMEAWRYERAPEEDLVLFFAEADFDGTSGASVLVPTPAAAGGRVIHQLCGAARGMCDELVRFGASEGPVMSGMGGTRRVVRAGEEPPTPERLSGGGQVPTNVIRAERERGRNNIVRGVTTDDHRRNFETLLEPVVQIFGVDRAGGGDPRLLVSFAIPGERLAGTRPPAAGGRTVYPIRVQLMTRRHGRAERYDVDTIRNFASAQPLGAGQYLTATFELPVPPGTYSATVVLSQQGGRGALSRIASVTAPAAGERLSISSLVLGSKSSGTGWNSGSQVVPLHPLNAFPKATPAELYYQLGGLSPGGEYRTRVELFPVGKGDSGAALTLSFTDAASSRFAEVSRSIGLGNLDPGRYRIRVTVSGGGGNVAEEAFLTVVR